jgi:hypothetical protein
MNRVRDNIDKLISAEPEAHSARLERFFERVQSNYDESIRAATRFFLLMLAAWFLTYAIKAKWIDKIGFFGLDLNRKMIVVSPFLVGLFSYGMLSAMAGAIVFWEAVSQSVCKCSRPLENIVLMISSPRQHFPTLSECSNPDARTSCCHSFRRCGSHSSV